MGSAAAGLRHDHWYIIYLCSTTLAGLVGCYGVASAFLRMMMLGFRRFHPLLLLMAMAYIPDEKVNFLLYTLQLHSTLLPGCAKIFAHWGISMHAAAAVPGTGMLCSTCVHKPLIGACLAASTITCVCGFQHTQHPRACHSKPVHPDGLCTRTFNNILTYIYILDRFYLGTFTY